MRAFYTLRYYIDCGFDLTEYREYAGSAPVGGYTSTYGNIDHSRYHELLLGVL